MKGWEEESKGKEKTRRSSISVEYKISLDMGNRDSRYDLIKPMIIAGKIKSFNDIFKFIPKTVVALDLGKKVSRFNGLMDRVEGFALEDLFNLARFCGVDEIEILQLVESEYKIRKNKTKKPK